MKDREAEQHVTRPLIPAPDDAASAGSWLNKYIRFQFEAPSTHSRGAIPDAPRASRVFLVSESAALVLPTV